MFWKHYFVFLTIWKATQLQVIITSIANYEEDESTPYQLKKISYDFKHYDQLLSFIPDGVSGKKDTLPEISIGVTEISRQGNEELRKDLSDIIDNLFEPHVPLSSDDDYIPLLNDSNFQANCSLNGSIVPCENMAMHAPKLDQTTVIKAIVLSIIGIFSYTGNIATLTSILRTGRQSTSTVYMLLVQLTIADLLVTTFCILIDAIWMLTVQWYGGNFLCKVVKFMQMFSLYLSTFVLVLIGFDRLCAVRFPMGRARAKKDVRKGIVCIWTLSALFSSPQVS